MKLLARVCSSIALLALPVAAISNCWTGAGSDTKWGTSANWSAGAPPAANDVAWFSSGGSSAGLDGNRTVDWFIFTNTFDLDSDATRGNNTLTTSNLNSGSDQARAIVLTGSNYGARRVYCNISTAPFNGANWAWDRIVSREGSAGAHGDASLYLYGRVTVPARVNGRFYYLVHAGDAWFAKDYRIEFNDTVFFTNIVNAYGVYLFGAAGATFALNASNAFNNTVQATPIRFDQNWNGNNNVLELGHSSCLDGQNVKALELGGGNTFAGVDQPTPYAGALSAFISQDGVTISRPVTVFNYFNTMTLGGNNTSGTATWIGDVTLNVGPTTPGTVELAAKNAGSVTRFAGVIKDNTSGNYRPVTITGAGTIALDGQNTYLGATTVNSGALLGGTGVVASATTVAGGATLAPGASIGTLTFGNSLTLNAGAVYAWEKGPDSTADQIIAGALTIDNAVTVRVFNVGGIPSYVITNTIFAATSFTGLENLQLDLSQVPSWVGGSFVDLGDGDIGLICITPEPSLMALLALPLLLRRRA